MSIKSRPSATYAASLFGLTILLLVLSRQVAITMENRYVPGSSLDYQPPQDDLRKGAPLRSSWTAKLSVPCIIVFSAGCRSCTVFGPDALEKNKDGLPVYFATREPESPIASATVKIVNYSRPEEELFKLWLTPRAYVLDRDYRLVDISPSGLEVLDLARFVRDAKR